MDERGTKVQVELPGAERSVEHAPNRLATSHGAIPQDVKAAIAYIRGNYGTAITIADLVAVAGGSERTLRRNFRRFVGTSPLAYLQRLRLAEARQALLRPTPGTSVTEVAAQFGFTHPGRFAAAYHARFSETPSATLQRAISLSRETIPEPRRRPPAPGCSVTGWQKPKLVIVPFRSHTLDESWLAESFVARVAASLTQSHDLSVAVIAPSRVPMLPDDLPGFLRQHGAPYGLLGQVVLSGERLRVVVRLVDVATDRHLWGDSLDGTTTETLDLEERIARAVLRAVPPSVVRAEAVRARDRDPQERLARDLTIQALPLARALDVVSTHHALSLAREAMELDADAALPAALAAMCEAQLAAQHGTPTPARSRQAALHLSRRAAALDSGDPRVAAARMKTALALGLRHELDALTTRVVATDPSSSWAWECRGFQHMHLGGDPRAASGYFAQALEIDDPGRSKTGCFHGIAMSHCFAAATGNRWGSFQDAILWSRAALVENPRATWLHRPLALYSHRMGDKLAAQDSVDRLRRACPDLTVSLVAESYPLAANPTAHRDLCQMLAETGLPL